MASTNKVGQSWGCFSQPAGLRTLGRPKHKLLLSFFNTPAALILELSDRITPWHRTPAGQGQGPAYIQLCFRKRGDS